MRSHAIRFAISSHQSSGTAILLKPGVIAGGSVTHECPLSRSVGYFLEPVIMLAPFAKKPIQLTLRGITTDEHDLSVSIHPLTRIAFNYSCYEKVDIIRTVTLPHLQLFGISDGLELRVRLDHTSLVAFACSYSINRSKSEEARLWEVAKCSSYVPSLNK